MELVRNEEKLNQIRKTAEALVRKMTLEEKVYQTLHSAPPIERLGIKGYDWWNEGLHGVARAGTATVFPQAIGLAATFDEDLIEQVAAAVSTEARAKYNMQQKYADTGRYKGLTLWSPNINIFRDPRWGRGHETYGEDPYLTTRLGVRFIEGLQGHDDNFMKAAACAKHFAVHSGPERLRHEFNAVVSKKDLYETYLPAFEACVKEAKVEAIMGAYNRTNGEPCCASKTLLMDTLREKWGFKGHVVSDCWAIQDFHEHHKVTKTPEESAALAMNHGCDLNCGNMFLHLLGAVEKGMVSEERLTQAVVNLYTTRLKLGTFDECVLHQAPVEENPYDRIPYSVVDSKSMRQFNREVSEKSIVLLKNKDGILPLSKEKIKTVAVIGPNANSRKALVGNYEGTASRYFTVSEGIQEYLGEEIRILVSEGCHLYKEDWKTNRIAEVKQMCMESDVVIACMGLDAGIEGEQGDAGNDFASGDKINLNLPGEQQQILEAAYESGKPVILLLLAGSALAVTWADEHIDAILQCWYPGAQGGNAIARVLFGDVSPQGHLPVTFYRTTEELPAFEDYAMNNRTYRYMAQEALYPFGYGLTYTHFAYSGLTVTKEQHGDEICTTLEVKVANIGRYECAETVQVYIKAMAEGTPNPQLKWFEKVELKAGEEKTIVIALSQASFYLVDEEGKHYIHSGVYQIYVGGSQPDARSCSLMGAVPLMVETSLLNGNNSIWTECNNI
jgi:beta-glucosidase